jgi:hypothetical protein
VFLAAVSDDKFGQQLGIAQGIVGAEYAVITLAPALDAISDEKFDIDSLRLSIEELRRHIQPPPAALWQRSRFSE